MKKLILFTFIAFAANSAFSQDYLDEISKKACECLSEIPDTTNTERYTIELGLCMIEAASPYKKQLKKDHGIDFNKIETQGEALGQLIAVNMVGYCPELLMKMVDKVGNEEQEAESSSDYFVGKVTAIKEGMFIHFSVRSDLGKTDKFYWLNFIESEFDLVNDYQKLQDKYVQITFTEHEFYDSRIQEYRTFKVIQKIELITE